LKVDNEVIFHPTIGFGTSGTYTSLEVCDVLTKSYLH
jgi:hypothetical protein